MLWIGLGAIVVGLLLAVFGGTQNTFGSFKGNSAQNVKGNVQQGYTEVTPVTPPEKPIADVRDGFIKWAGLAIALGGFVVAAIKLWTGKSCGRVAGLVADRKGLGSSRKGHRKFCDRRSGQRYSGLRAGVGRRLPRRVDGAGFAVRRSFGSHRRRQAGHFSIATVELPLGRNAAWPRRRSGCHRQMGGERRPANPSSLRRRLGRLR